jgi:hypothetical protein
MALLSTEARIANPQVTMVARRNETQFIRTPRQGVPIEIQRLSFEPMRERPSMFLTWASLKSPASLDTRGAILDWMDEPPSD